MLSHLFSLTSVVRNKLAGKGNVFAAFIDFEKAFDCVDRELLFYCLLKNDICGKVYRSIKALYTNTSACVRVNGMFTGWFYTNSGVRQGDSLSPTLFAIFINGLAKEIKRTGIGVKLGNSCMSILLYADDIVLMC